ncbi:type III polyketide synthase [Bacillus methanolicus]|uniref:Chalcone synthase n=1 Tax=Bacillus methanolicus (strain MGA3 / ATCC 53907) TaxID=796606 RepID=I3E9R3_BACMM|nr:3-oxoacyl-[acyl-carrier-protein] synthase III C-terminal domain-containing protein [Bacillus methanolicus]AIE60482.1 Putative chalcone synthase [Bacillus methanolicus MGA3]EIJ83234.1 naringenin-chalcone synthase [Bacillus methanolicus MGA3]UQD52494.1 type III polyketide synthase [Bacillus methanolicus]
MPIILSAAEAIPPYVIEQQQAMEFAGELFSDSFKDIERLLTAFQNGQIEKRHFVKGLEWFKHERTFEEKNNAYIEKAVQLGAEAITKCLTNSFFLKNEIPYEEIDAIITVSTTGLATPSIEARIMNILPFSSYTKRIPIFGLGCAGGAAGLSRAYEYCLAFPKENVLVLSIELCSLTFQRNDHSKSNLIGASLFADGAACAVVCGRASDILSYQKRASSPNIFATQSATMKNTLDVMGWDVKNDGLFVVFSKDIPTKIETWLKPNVEKLIREWNIGLNDIDHFIAHPGGKKVLEAYVKELNLPENMTKDSLEILKEYGNMSSATIIYVLRRIMEKANKGEIGLAAALGPGFSSELLLMRWV